MTTNTRMEIWIQNIIRLYLTINLLSLVSPQSTASTISVTPYPSEVQQMVQQRMAKGQPGSWSAWTPWTPCTRSCGGGVTVQTRECRSKPLGRHRRRVHSIETQHHCVGLYKRIHICNTKECPGTTDFRQEQCSRYDGQEFLGRAYTWEPFMDAPNQCALNCRAKGYRFYATLNATVEDGTPCRGYIIGHDTDRWVCIAGQCKHVGCDGVVGSDQRYDTCGVCGGNNSTCRVVSGLFTRPQLPVGYNLITQIPQAACNLSIIELKRSRNYLALRKVDGTFILNGNWAINWSGEFDALGTKFSYHREDEDIAETITSPGPLAEPLDLMVIYQQPNPGIRYQYQLPVAPTDNSVSVYKAQDLPLAPQLRQADSPSLPKEKGKDKNVETRFNGKVFPYGNNVLGSELQGYSGDEAPKPKSKGKKRKFAWKITGFSECSKSCGGGVQTAVVVCIREHSQATVPDKRCASLERPSSQVVRCNLKPCVAEWVGGEWSECSVTCGEGVQTREILCRQQITPTLTMTVAEGACLTPPSPLLTRSRPCQRSPCGGVGTAGGSSGQWTVGAWSQCSAKCGQGVQTRSVLCPSGNCNINERPATETSCTLPPCQSHRHSHVWLYTDWTQECSESCGTGVQKRRTVCSAGPKMENLCDASLRPDNQRVCSSDKQCGALWFSGPWGPCTASCGWGRQTRSVICVSKPPGGQMFPTADENCRSSDRPAAEQQCKLQACGPEWYMGEWSQCSRPCDTGVQRRDVRCLDETQQVASGCSETSKPASRRSCNSHKCPTQESEKKDVGIQSNVSLRDQPQLQNITKPEDDDCKDRFRNCHLVVQARLCKYKYYRSSCCQACQQHKL